MRILLVIWTPLGPPLDYVFCVNSLVTWSFQRQKFVTLNITKSEYVAAATACKQAIWLRQLLKDLGCSQEQPTILFVDNQSLIRLTQNPEFYKRMKHIDIYKISFY